MRGIEIFQVDAFTDKVFHGNPAAVCLITTWLNDELMQAIAVENNLSETAFVVQDQSKFYIRWFTPRSETNLCGHATLAAGFVLFEEGYANTDKIQFINASGDFSVSKKGSYYTLDFPRLTYTESSNAAIISSLIDCKVEGIYDSELDYLAVLSSDRDVATVNVNLLELSKLPKRGLIVTARANDVDFYSRCFYPKYNIAEDPVTGSAHCVLAPFWCDRLNKPILHGIQGSYRKGQVDCKVMDSRVLMSGSCRLFMKGYLVI